MVNMINIIKMNKKAIVIIGCSGAGKTWTLRELFGVPQLPYRYGIAGAIKKGLITIGDYSFLPEISAIKRPEEVKDAIESSKYLMVDLQWMFRSMLFKFIPQQDCEIIHLKPSKDTLWEHINKRKQGPSSSKTKEEILDINLKLIKAIDKKGFKTMNQQEVLSYLKSKVYE